MNIALICIAKNEDNYIDEWLSYHLKLGFTKVFVYQNNWRYNGDKKYYGDKVEWIEFDGEAMQMKAYNDFIDNRRDGYDFAAFFDVDEFLCLKKHSNVEQLLVNYIDCYGIGVSWRIFGDNGLKTINNGEYSCIKRFTRCGNKLDKHIKTILNLNMSKGMFHFVNPHFVDASLQYDVILDLDMHHAIHGPWDNQAKTEIAQLNHYCCKTYDEFLEKKRRGKADTRKDHPQFEYIDKNFYDNNLNDVEDLTLITTYLNA